MDNAAPGIEAVVSDGAGNTLLSLKNGAVTGCASAPASVEVLDRVPVPGMTAPDGTTPVFGFAVEYLPKSSTPDTYAMGLSDPRTLVEGKDSGTGCRLVPTGNGGLGASVIFNRPAFPSKDAAKAWMATQQYAQLKALLVSLNYV